MSMNSALQQVHERNPSGQREDKPIHEATEQNKSHLINNQANEK